MNEIKKISDSETLRTRRPERGSVFRLDGRWAQEVTIVEGSDANIMVKFLDDGSTNSINWDAYDLINEYTAEDVSSVLSLGDMTDTEAENVYWGPEQEEHPRLKGQVKVFGEYRKRAVN